MDASHMQRVIVTLCVRVWIEIHHACTNIIWRVVTLCVRVWIEIVYCFFLNDKLHVTLCVRVWIEINRPPSPFQAWDSHPLREGVD